MKNITKKELIREYSKAMDKIDELKGLQAQRDALELAVKTYQEDLRQKERDIHVIYEANKALREEVKHLTKQGERYRMDIQEAKRKKFINWDYLNYLYFLPFTAMSLFLLAGLGWLIYLDPMLMLFLLFFLLVVASPFMAETGYKKLKEKGLL